MKKIILLSVFALMMFSCAKDDSTMIFPENNKDFSFVTIESPTEKLSVDFGDTIKFAPTVTQTVEGNELTYKWTANEVNGSSYGDAFDCCEGLTLTYLFPKVMTYRVTLEVKNKWYSAFKEWTLDVRSQDDGLYVVGRDDNGNSNVAFARSLSQTDVLEGKKLTFVSDMLTRINPKIDVKNIVRIQKTLAAYDPASTVYFFIYTSDHIYVANPNTFEIYNDVDFSAKYPGEKIVDVHGIDDNYPESLIITDKGTNVFFSKKELQFVERPEKSVQGADKVYNNLFYPSFNGLKLSSIWVKDSKIWSTFNHPSNQSNILLNNTCGIFPAFADGEVANVFSNRNITAIGQMNGNSVPNYNYYVISTAKDNSKSVLIMGYVLSATYTRPPTPMPNPFAEKFRLEYTSESDIAIKEGTSLVANGRYGAMYYSNGSKIYSWYPNPNSPNRLPADAAIDLGAGKEVTTMAISYDMKQLYVGFIDHNRAGAMKGGLFIYTALGLGTTITDPEPVEKFEGISYKPVQVGYKARGSGKYNPQ